MAATTTHLMTVDEFSELPEDDSPFYHELRHGEVVAVVRAVYEHYTIQRRIRRLLEDFALDGVVDIEFAFRPLEHELRVADVAYVSAPREKGINRKGYLEGAPDLVIEVLSPSNSATEIYDKEQLCLENGSKEFWVVDPIRREVRVSTPDGTTRTWRSGQEIPLSLFGENKLPVYAIFQ
jgi:Uma2 family endonuclease